MKKSILKNKLIIFTLALMGIFFVDAKDVEATRLEPKDYTLQCIYSDGGLYTLEYASTLSTSSATERVYNRTPYNLAGVVEDQSSTTGGSVFVGESVGYDAGNYLRCYSNGASAYYAPDNDSLGTNATYYKFSNSVVKFNESDFNMRKGWFGYKNSDKKAAETAINNAIQFKLVSESFILKPSAPKPNATLYYVQEAEQASGSDRYLQVMVYDNIVLLKTENWIARLENSVTRRGETMFSNVKRDSKELTVSGTYPDKLFLNNPEPKIIMAGTGASKGSYYFSGVRYVSSGGKTTNSYYITDDPKDFEDNSISSELCEETMPETAKVLKDVIKYAQLLVPALLIILVSLDIGKMVVSGNLDEEMPKQKKRIVFRFIAAVVFFFLPLLVRIMLNLTINSGEDRSSTIQLIDCLFE